MNAPRTEKPAPNRSLRWSRGAPFDIVFLDHMMTGLSGGDLACRIRSMPRNAETKLILLSSISQTATDRVLTGAADAVLERPVRWRQLVDCIERIFGAGASAAEPASAPIAAAAKPEAKPQPAARPLRVLVAEDNKINQKFVRIVLAKAGHAVDFVENGHEAVDAVRRKDYDVILMDAQMPELDGVGATRQIRALAPPTRDVPIVALTAHALSGARETYLAAGMDDDVSKPIRTEALLAKLAERGESRLGGPSAPVGEAPPPPAVAPDLDRDTVRSLARVMPAGALSDLFDLYAVNADERIAEIRRQADLGDLAAVRREAHTMIGVAGNLGVARVGALAVRLEAVCRANDETGAQAAVADLIGAHAAAGAAIRDWLAEQPVGDRGTTTEAAVA